jgi:hypothetical protein
LGAEIEKISVKEAKAKVDKSLRNNREMGLDVYAAQLSEINKRKQTSKVKEKEEESEETLEELLDDSIPEEKWDRDTQVVVSPGSKINPNETKEERKKRIKIEADQQNHLKQQLYEERAIKLGLDPNGFHPQVWTWVNQKITEFQRKAKQLPPPPTTNEIEESFNPFGDTGETETETETETGIETEEEKARREYLLEEERKRLAENEKEDEVIQGVVGNEDAKRIRNEYKRRSSQRQGERSGIVPPTERSNDPANAVFSSAVEGDNELSHQQQVDAMFVKMYGQIAEAFKLVEWKNEYNEPVKFKNGVRDGATILKILKQPKARQDEYKATAASKEAGELEEKIVETVVRGKPLQGYPPLVQVIKPIILDSSIEVQYLLNVGVWTGEGQTLFPERSSD